MTKEVDFLSLGKSENSTKTNTNTSKKEGLSLFDSLLVDNKKTQTNSSETNIEKSTENKNTQTSSKESSSQNTKNLETEKNNLNKEEENSQISKEKVVDKKEDSQKQQVTKNIETETSNTKPTENQNKTEVKQQTSATSLLDRMVLEAKKSIKSVNTENSTVDVKEEKTVADNSKETKLNNTEEKLKTNTVRNSTKVDTEVQNKTETSSDIKIQTKEESKTLENEKKVDKKVDTSEKSNLTEVKNESVKKTDDTKVEVKNSNIEQKSVTTNKNTDLLNSDTKEETKNIVKDTISSETKNTNSSNEERTTKDKIVNKDFLTTLDSEEAPSSNIKVENIEIEKNDTQEVDKKLDKNSNNILKSSDDIEQKIDTKNIESDSKPVVTPEQKESAKVIDKSSISDKEAKNISAPKEQVQTTMNFADEAVETKEKSINSKSSQNESKIESKNSNIETKTNTESDIKINQDEEVKNSNLTEEINKVDAKNENTSLENEVNVVKKNDTEVKDSKTNTEQKIVNSVENSTASLKNETVEEAPISKVDATKTNGKGQTQDLSKLDTKAFVQEEERVNVDKESLKNISEQKTETKEEPKVGKSLMDRLFDNAKEQTILTRNTNVNNQTLESQTSAAKSNDVATNIFLSTQKNSIYAQLIANKSEGVKLVKNASTVEDVKQGAKVLDLGLEDTSVEVEKTIKESVFQQTTRTLDSKISVLDKIAFEKNMKTEELINSTLQSSTTSTTTATTSEETVVNLNVNSTLALSIQNRIIGAQQQMASMMSDVARNMYENYKPPVTAFRLNLFPAQLGHIAILMKNDRENSISISMNMSQSSTLDSFVENQGVLRDALNRTFENQQTSFSLDFNMEEGSDNSAYENQDDDSQNNQTHSSDEIMESIIQNQDATEDSNYM